MEDIVVSYSHMQHGIAKLKSSQTDLQQEVEAMRTAIINLTGGMGWNTRRASRIFGDSAEQWREGANHMLDGLTGMAEYLQAAMEAHEQLDTNLGGQASDGPTSG